MNSPIIEVGVASQMFDLHNDGEFREFSADFRDQAARVVWTVKHLAWISPERPDPRHRSMIGSVALAFSEVRSLVLSGELLEVGTQSNSLDFLEYFQDDLTIGTVRIVMMNCAEIAISARRCQLRTIEVP